MKDLEKTLPSLYGEVKERSTIDGVRVSLEKGWILVRPSGTEPLIRITVEADSRKTAQNIMEKGLKQVEKSVAEAVK
jgi:phosphoglucosamine mutase